MEEVAALVRAHASLGRRGGILVCVPIPEADALPRRETEAVIERALGRLPLLGVCLGHQAIAHVCGARVVRAPELRHGKTSPIHHDGEGVFAGIPSPVEATRYHSLAVDPDSLPPDLRVSARTDDGVVMGIRHEGAAAEGVQFHPESILTRHGHDMLRNFLAGAGVTASPPPPVPR